VNEEPLVGSLKCNPSTEFCLKKPPTILTNNMRSHKITNSFSNWMFSQVLFHTTNKGKGSQGKNVCFNQCFSEPGIFLIPYPHSEPGIFLNPNPHSEPGIFLNPNPHREPGIFLNPNPHSEPGIFLNSDPDSK
jgi:hypothetical protein